MKAKVLLSVILAAFVVTGMSSCSVEYKARRSQSQGATVPPGQVKKVTGSQSAAPYAPGQQKKKKKGKKEDVIVVPVPVPVPSN